MLMTLWYLNCNCLMEHDDSHLKWNCWVTYIYVWCEMKLIYIYILHFTCIYIYFNNNFILHAYMYDVNQEWKNMNN
jgi:hypothetical protein